MIFFGKDEFFSLMNEDRLHIGVIEIILNS